MIVRLFYHSIPSHLAACLAIVLAAISCTKTDLVEEEKYVIADYEKAHVRLNLDFSEESLGTPGTEFPDTKAVDDPESAQSTVIRNLCILQYDGTSADARPVGKAHYYHDDADHDSEEFLDLNRICLTDSQGATHTLVILTNTFREVTPASTLGEMLKMQRRLEPQAESELFGHAGQAETFPDDTVYYQRMNALAVTKVSDAVQIKARLRRSYSRLNLRINNVEGSGLEIKTVRLRNIPVFDYFISDYHYIDPVDGTEKTLVEGPFHDTYDAGMPTRFDYPLKYWTASENGGGTQTFTFYTPCNMRGSQEDLSTADKIHSEITRGATYVEIYAKDVRNVKNVRTRRYIFYLGADLDSDFNLNPNTSYNYNIKFTGAGKLETDARVQEFGEDFAVDSNCYMLKPSPLDTCVYTFNVVHRINTFWDDNRYKISADFPSSRYANNTLPSTGERHEWHAMIIWSDFKMSQEQAKDFLDVEHGGADGIGSDNYADPSYDYFAPDQRVTVRVPAGFKGGNVLVGVYSDSPAKILWSWHLWITDYDPDDIKGMMPQEGKVVYGVPGGEVHHYDLTKWKPGAKYAEAYSMDRNIGALAQTFESTWRYGKMYQYGRKDPFNSNITAYTYDSEFVPTSVSNGARQAIAKNTLDSDQSTSGKNVPYSVENPRIYIYKNGRWFDSMKSFTHNASWADPKMAASYKSEYEEQASKSFFDPCPPGWTIPVDSWLQGLNADNFPYGKDRSFANRGKGRTYCPHGYQYQIDNMLDNGPSAYFPATGNLTYTGNWQDATAGTWGDQSLWTMSATRFRFNSSSIWVSTNSAYGNADAYQIRCVSVTE